MPVPFSLGNFGGQLTADELTRAVAAAGGRPDDIFPAQQQTVPPAPPVPAAEPAPAPDMSVRSAGHGQRALNAYDSQNLGDANERIAIAGRSGDSHGQDTQSYREQADLHGQQAATSKRLNDDAESRVASRREHEDKYQAHADRLYEDMRTHATPPGPSTMDKVLGIVGMVGALGGKAGLAQGAQALGSMLGGNNLESWAAEQQSKGNLYKNALGMVGSDREGQSHDLDVAQKMTALRAHEIDSGLEQVKSMGLGRDAERHATDLQLQLRTQVRTGLKSMEQDKIRQAAKGQANAKDQYFWSIPLPQLREMPSQVLGKDGAAVLAQRIKNDQGDRAGEANIAKSQAEASAKAAEGGPQQPLPGMVATVPLAPSDLHDIKKNRQTLSDIQGDLKRLGEIRARNKGNVFNDPNDVTQAAEILDGLSGKFSVLQGKGAPSKDEKEGIMANLINPTDVAFRANPEKVYAALSDRLEGNFRQGLEDIGIKNGDGSGLQPQTFQAGVRGVAQGPAPAAGASPAPQAQPTPITMRDPNGRTFQVHPARVQQLQANGWSAGATFEQPAPPPVQAAPPPTGTQLAYAQPTVAEQAGKPVADMNDQEYAAYVLQQGGY